MPELELIGRVAARRLDQFRQEASTRAWFCILGLEAPVATAIARHAALLGTEGEVEVFLHPSLVDGDPGKATISDVTAPWLRNHARPGVKLTLCTVAPDKVKDSEPTLAHKDKVDDSWLLQDMRLWANEGLDQCASEIRDKIGHALAGALEAGVAHDVVTIAAFVRSISELLVKDGLAPEKAVRAALPALRLPRDAGDPRLKITESGDAAVRFFRKVLEEAQPPLYLKARDGDPLNRGELRTRLEVMREEGTLAPDVAAALEALVADRRVHDGQWTETQAAVAALGWEAVEPFFSEAKRKPKLPFGAETRSFFDRQYPGSLTPPDEQLLDDLAKDNIKPSEEVDDFFHRHRARLQTEPKLYRRWEKLVFRAPIETADLTEGLLRLAHRAFPETAAEEERDTKRVLVVRLPNSEKMDFWTSDKNIRILRYLRDRYRGLDTLLAPHAILDFGRCWSENWEKEVDDENLSRSKTATELLFEAFLVEEKEVTAIVAGGAKPPPNRAQLIWKPAPEALGLSMSLDMRRLRPEQPSERTRLMTGCVRQNRASRTGSLGGLDIKERTTLIDAFGQSDGDLANADLAAERIDITWPSALDRIVDQKVLLTDTAERLRAKFATFHQLYGEALHRFLRGEGLAADALLAQAEAYGDLLASVLDDAPQEICQRELLAPLLAVGVVAVEGESAAVATAWQPLRLAELGAKARQLAAAIGLIIEASNAQAADIEDLVNDRVATLCGTFYGDVALSDGLEPVLLVETQNVADYSLLQKVAGPGSDLPEETAASVIAAFDRVANEYLNLRPHERSNFSIVVLNAASENLPLSLARGLSRRIEDDPDLRCELVVTDDDPLRLRDVYERQNRRIHHEIDSGLASEAARNFLSRLRVGIFSPDTLTHESGPKSNDIVLLQDVIAGSSKVRWVRSDAPSGTESLATFVPTARSKRRPFRKGNTTSALYLTAPRQPRPCRTYVTALRALERRDPTSSQDAWLPVQEVEFRSGEVHQLLGKAHRLGNWVMTFDRVADRRLIDADRRRIIRYFSAPNSTHNVIVSTEISEQELGDCISDDLDVILPGADKAEISALRHELFTRAARLSGGVVMRGAQWANYAHELLGLVLSQRELERLLAQGRENRTAWFFLDDFRDWLDLSGEMADILALDFSVGPAGPEIRLVVAESKYCGQDNLLDHRRRSARQLDSTWTALNHRLLGGAASLDPSIWRNRLADMVLEHMEPFDHVGGITQDAWLDHLRGGTVPITVDGHSLVFSHEAPAIHEPMPFLPDEEKPIGERRRQAQWLFARPETAKALRWLGDDTAPPLLSVPLGWPAAPKAGEQGGDGAAPDGSGRDGGGPKADSPPAAAQEATAAPDSASEAAPKPSAPPEPEPTPATEPEPEAAEVPTGNESGLWSAPIARVLQRLRRSESQAGGEQWLQQKIADLRSALQLEGMDAPVLGHRLTPNTGLVYVGGRTLTVGWLERKQTDLLTRHGLDIVRITPLPGQIAIGLRRPKRSILHLAEAWLRREKDGSIAQAMAPLLGEKEDDGSLCFLPLAAEFDGQDRAAPHSLISGTTGSGKGILVTNLILDLCALNSPAELELHLIDPKRGVDYAWARDLPHLNGGIVDDQEQAKALLVRLVADMEARYEEIAAENCRNIDQFNRKVAPERRLSRVVIFFDEVANWMQDDDFKDVVDGLINKIATKSRAAGFHLFMVYQRADNQVMTMQLRTNLGNKLILRLGDEGSSKIALGEKGAERLLGKGHLIAKLDTDERLYLQVPFIDEDDVEALAQAVIETWRTHAEHARAAE